jgi:hypothetical protein
MVSLAADHSKQNAEQQRLNPEHVVGQLDLFPAKDARS